MSSDQNNHFENILSKLTHVKKTSTGYLAHCPAHNDKQSSLSLTLAADGKILVKCFAGCGPGAIMHAIGLEIKDLFSSILPKVKEATHGCTLTQYAELKGLPVPFLRGLGISNFNYYGNKVIQTPYRHQDGSDGAVQYRIALQGEDKFRFKKGSKPFLYGLDHDFKSKGYVVIVEGPSDAHTLLFNKIPVLGLPSADGWNEERDAPQLDGIDKIFVWIEPDKGGEAVKSWLSTSQIRDRVSLISCDGFKDVSELYLHDRENFKANIEKLISEAIPWQETEAKQSEPIDPSPAPSLHRDEPEWPAPLKEEVYYGVVGKVVRFIEPHTESDPAALLSQLLAVIGNIIGRTAHFKVEGDLHYLKIDPVLVGETSKSRKGIAFGYARKIMKHIDPTSQIVSGLSSGEGLIWQVHDELRKSDPIREKGRIIGYQEVVADPGISDKRLLVIETEFASTLRVIGREGNILSPVVRQAWDDGDLQALAKNSPAKATGSHITIIGHITRDELRRYLDRTEIANGFANRFMWLCVRRSKVLPEGSRFDDQGFESLLKELITVVEFGRQIGELRRNDEARGIWHEIYPVLSEGKPGLLGAVISRAEAQVMRLACIYAVFDKSQTIRKEHLLAALALWDYAEASARYIFGDATGDWVADRILQAARESDGGLSRTEIRDIFSRHVNEGRIERALSLLERNRMTKMVKEASGGRPIEKWTST